MPKIKQNICSNCSQPAEFAVLLVLSTLGRSPREQARSKSVSFCADCVRELAESECWGTVELQRSVNNALTQLISCLSSGS